MPTLDEIVEELEPLTADSLEELAHFVEYLKWKQGLVPRKDNGRTWTFDFVEHFRTASVSAEHGRAGMEAQVGEAACGGEARMALWEHPPVQGAAIVEYQVPVPQEVRNLRLSFSTGIRDGSQLAPGNIVAFRIFVAEWRIWSATQHARTWNQHEVEMPAVAGDIARIQFVTDGLGNHQWAWAAWGQPRLAGELPG
jgi:hypothetical protein